MDEVADFGVGEAALAFLAGEGEEAFPVLRAQRVLEEAEDELVHEFAGIGAEGGRGDGGVVRGRPIALAAGIFTTVFVIAAAVFQVEHGVVGVGATGDDARDIVSGEQRVGRDPGRAAGPAGDIRREEQLLAHFAAAAEHQRGRQLRQAELAGHLDQEDDRGFDGGPDIRRGVESLGEKESAQGIAEVEVFLAQGFGEVRHILFRVGASFTK